MGRQVGFFMLDDDYDEFWQFVYQDLSALVTAGPHATPKFRYLKTHTDVKKSDHKGRLYICHPLLPILRRHVKRIRLQKSGGAGNHYSDVGKIAYYIDSLAAPVVEFDRSYISSRAEFVPGRIWASMDRLENNALVWNGRDFVDFYEKIARWIRRHGKRVEGVRGYVFKNAREWHKSGGKLKSY